MSSGIHIRVPAKVIWFGEHVVHRIGGIASAISKYMYLDADVQEDASSHDPSLTVVGEDPALVRALDTLLQVLITGRTLAASYRVTIRSDIPPHIGLGSSSALTVGAVAFLRTISGLPFDRTAIFEQAKRIEWEASGASGLDVAACVYGGTIFYTPGEQTGPVSLPHFPKQCFLMPSGEPHAASCGEAVGGEEEEAMQRLMHQVSTPRTQPLEEVELGELLDETHELLKRSGLSSETVDIVRERLGGHAKVTGRGRGGCLLSTRFGGWPVDIVSSGVRVEDGMRRDAVPDDVAWIARNTLANRMVLAAESTAIAHPNIALVKYWGKEAHQMPSNASLSLSLPHFYTRTTVRLRPHSAKDCQERMVCGFADARVRSLVIRMLQDVIPPGHCVEVTTHNSFPSACGIASSASGFAALVRAIRGLLRSIQRPGDDEEGRHASTLSYWVQQWARLGSGSAIRSALDDEAKGNEDASAPALVSWEGATAHSYPVHERLRGLEHMLVVFDPFPKRVSSSDGHALAPTCPFHGVRVSTANGHVRDLVGAFSRGDFDTVRSITEAEALTMHLVMYGSEPRIRYMDDASLDFVARFVAFRNERRIDAMYTVDAGSNVHLLWRACARDSVLGFVYATKHMFTFFEGVKQPRFEVVVLSGKRFSGKTTLANALVERVREGGGVQLLHLSGALKRAYWAQTTDAEAAADSERREVKERHRAAMIAFGEEARARDPYHWCRLAWRDGVVEGGARRILVSDARRPVDLDFFRSLGACVHVRVQCTDAERVRRGWVWEAVVDEGASECGLDDSPADVCVDGGGAYDAESLWQCLLRMLKKKGTS